MIIIQTRISAASKELIGEFDIVGAKKPKQPTNAIDIPAIAEIHATQYVQAIINPGNLRKSFQ